MEEKYKYKEYGSRRDIRFTHISLPKKETRGYGFVKEDGPLALIRCPHIECGRENYAMNVTSGVCTWCGFNSNNVERDYGMEKM